MFWSSDKLTGSQTVTGSVIYTTGFWSSDKLTGSQTIDLTVIAASQFWSSDKLTGSQTLAAAFHMDKGFGAVTNWLVVKHLTAVLIR